MVGRRLYLPLLLVLVSGTYLYTATERAILDDGDALYAHVAQQMVARGDWVTPHANGVRFLDKPPMMYWLMALSYELLGVTEFAARLPSVLALIGTVCLLYFMGQSGEPSAGLAAGLAAAFCVGSFLFTRMVFPDMLFVFFLTLSLASFWRWFARADDPVLPAMLFYAALAGAVLTKGLLGLVFPVAILALFFFLWVRDWKRLKGICMGRGILLFLALAVPWHVLAARRNPGFLWYFFVNEQFLRFLGKRQPFDYESISLPLFWILILVWLFPWTVFLPAARYLLQSPQGEMKGRRAMICLSLSWVAVVLAFFSVSSRIEHYSLPLVPPFALLLGMTLFPDQSCGLSVQSRWQRSLDRGFTFLGGFGVMLGVGLLLLATLSFGGWLPSPARPTGSHPLQAFKYYFAPLFELPPGTLAGLEGPLIKAALAFSVGTFAAWRIHRRGRRMVAILVLSSMMAVFCLLAFESLGVCEEILSSRQFGKVLSRHFKPGDRAIVVGDFETANSLNFYAPLLLEVYDGKAAVLEWGLRFADTPSRIVSTRDLQMSWKSSQRVFLLCPNDRVSTLPVARSYVVLRSGGRTLLCNQPL